VANCLMKACWSGLVSSARIRASQVSKYSRFRSTGSSSPCSIRVPVGALRSAVMRGHRRCVGQRPGAGGEGGQQIADVRVAQPGQRAAGMGLGADSLVQGSEAFGHCPGAIIEEFSQVVAQAAACASPGPVGFFFGRTLDAVEVGRDAGAVDTDRGDPLLSRPGRSLSVPQPGQVPWVRAACW
jgi:hypothetical protein